MLALRGISFHGHALPEPFVRLELEGRLAKAGLLPKTTGAEGRRLQDEWDAYRRSIRTVGLDGGAIHVLNRVIEPLREAVGFATLTRGDPVQTREGEEEAGWLLAAGDARLRVFALDVGADLDAPTRRGRAYRFSPTRVAQRVLLATGERAALLTNGVQLRFLVCDPARPESHLAFRLDRGEGGWAGTVKVPDSFRILVALASPGGLALLPDLMEAARLNQVTVTKSLRKQARAAIEGFVQELLDHPENEMRLGAHPNRAALAIELWHEGLILIYRLLFTLKLEASADPARAFSFASSSLWKSNLSPNSALGDLAKGVLSGGPQTGRYLEDGLRTLFRLFANGISSSELKISPLGGALFGGGTTPLLDSLRWGERAVAKLLVNLLWTEEKKTGLLRVHYGTLDVEDLGRVYEALLELEPGIAAEPMCRLRRQKLEVVVPLAQGQRYRGLVPVPEGAQDDEEDNDPEDDEPRGKKTKVSWEGEIAPGRFYLRVGLGRKSTGSYYTPHPFVRFLVQETLGPQATERSPTNDPNPNALLGLKVLDPAMGSGHFLVEACRFLGEKLYEACRLCDELAVEAEQTAAGTKSEKESNEQIARATELRCRVQTLPDPDDQMLAYLPSRAVEREAAGLSQAKAMALARRLVAVHCLYGVDKNPLAVELAKLALWLESYAEGLPLTFLDHRLICGDSLTGPLFENLLTYPGTGGRIEYLFGEGLTERLTSTLREALAHVRDLEATVGKDIADLEAKRLAKERLDGALAPFRLLAAAWSGGVMLGPRDRDDIAYSDLVAEVARQGDTRAVVARNPKLATMVKTGEGGVAYDLVFPEVFHPDGRAERSGFDAVLGNPPWDAIQFKTKEFLASFDLRILDAPTKRERTAIEERLVGDHSCALLFADYKEVFERLKRANDALCEYQKVEVEGDLAGRQVDSFRVFMERNALLLGPRGLTGVLVPAAFHANEGATGIRQLYLERMSLRCCYSFENRRKLFEIHASFKFALVVAGRPGPTSEFPCGFYLNDMEWLFGDRSGRELRYSLDFVKRTGGEYLSLLEATDSELYRSLSSMFDAREPFGEVLKRSRLTVNTSELPMLGPDVFVPLRKLLERSEEAREPGVTQRINKAGYAPLHEGKTFSAYDDQFGDSIRYLVRLKGLANRPRWLSLCRFYRYAHRAIAAATNERTGVAVFLPPGVVSTRKAATDITPSLHPNWHSLRTVALFNSFPWDVLLRAMVQTDVSKFIVDRLPAPSLRFEQFIVHSALRLTCNHAGYEPLWREQVGGAWFEAKPSLTWPVLEGNDARWAIRSAIDAVVADAYALSRDQYAHVLSTFSHKSYPKAPELCLGAFDELRAIGLEVFTRKRDPYWDIVLNEDLPKPVIDIPIPGELDLRPESPGKAPRPARRRTS